jgi:hypothetical protein
MFLNLQYRWHTLHTLDLNKEKESPVSKWMVFPDMTQGHTTCLTMDINP